MKHRGHRRPTVLLRARTTVPLLVRGVPVEDLLAPLRQLLGVPVLAAAGATGKAANARSAGGASPVGTQRTAGSGTPDDVVDEQLTALVHRAQNGDAQAFGELYDRYVDTVYRYVYYRVGQQQLAEDLVSETFLRALRRIDSFAWQGKDIAAWFVTIARNLITDHFKSSRYKLEVSTDNLLATGDKPGSDSTEGSVLSTLSNATLLEAVRKLGAEQQECLVLRFLQGLSVTETALAMGKNEGAIKALQYRAVRALGKALPDGFTP